MKSHSIAISLFVATIALGAGAQTSKHEAIKLYVPKDLPLPAAAPTIPSNTPETKADLLIYSASGLEALDDREVGPDKNSGEYRRAVAKYEYLRASPQFTELVDQLSHGKKPLRVSIVSK